MVNVVIGVQAFYLLNCRSLHRSFFTVPLFSNRMIWIGIGATVLAQVIFTYVPIFHQLFHTDDVPAHAWLRVLAVGVASFIIGEVVKGGESAFDPRSRGS